MINDNFYHYDVIVIGGGHAGTEAAAASARKRAKTLLLTHNIETLGQMSCNPAIGGIGKGHLVKEVDALGGIMGAAIDEAGIQFRILNQRKGPAVRATRAQADRQLYRQAIRKRLEHQENLNIFQQAVVDLVIENHRVQGVVTQSGLTFYAKAVVLTVGTFLGGTIHIGHKNYGGGRAGDPASTALAKRFRALPFRVGRLKTGTPPRIDGKSIDFSKLVIQPGDDPLPRFSCWNQAVQRPTQIPCYITYTNQTTHQLIEENLSLSAMYSGHIDGVGPRYCPSIEDKIVRFADKQAHQIFLEPEGLHTQEFYPNGLSTSLPFEVQLAFIRSIEGLAQAHITRPGYAIEYDYFDPRDLSPTLETKIIERLFFAGQINGTTGYEEAAAQGILAGLNAAAKALEAPEWYPSRQDAYLGVLIDDLITQGTLEPYRMFTSRAEHRLLLREDNADARLAPVANDLGLLDHLQWQAFQNKQNSIAEEHQRLSNVIVQPNSAAASFINQHIERPLEREYWALELLKRPEITYDLLCQVPGIGRLPAVAPEVGLQVEIQQKYEGYIQRQQLEVEKLKRFESQKIPVNFNYRGISGLSNEVCEKLEQVRPSTVGQASRISGVTPSAVSLILVFLKKRNHVEEVAIEPC